MLAQADVKGAIKADMMAAKQEAAELLRRAEDERKEILAEGKRQAALAREEAATRGASAAFARAAELSPKYAQASLNRDRVQRGLDQGQRIVSNDTLLKLREGLFDETPPLGTGPADGIGIDLPSSLSPDGE